MVKFGIAFGIFLLRSVIISATEECDDSAYLQRQQSQPMTPVQPSYTFMEVGTKGSIEASPETLTCGAEGMYDFGGPNDKGTCFTVNPNTPDATNCTYSDFNNAEYQSTCWFPFQGNTDYCADTFEPSSVSQVTIEGINVPQNDATQGGKQACFTRAAMPQQFCPNYVCVQGTVDETVDQTTDPSGDGDGDGEVALAQGLKATNKRSCYNTAGKTCKVEDDGVTITCTEWNPTDGSDFCLASLNRVGDDTSAIIPIQSFAIQWECCQSGGGSGDPHIRTMDGKHYTLLQEGTFKLWSFTNVSTEYHSAPLPQLKHAKVDWEVFVHYSTGRSFAKGLLLVDKTLAKPQLLELTSETCRWRARSGTGEWMFVDRPMPLFTPDGSDFVTGFNLTATGRKNGKMDVRFLMNTRYGIKRIASMKISCQPGHHINTKLRLDKMSYKKAVAGQIRPGRKEIVQDRSASSNISQTLTEMRRMSSLQMMQDQEFFVDNKWVDVGGSSNAAEYLKLVDDDMMTDARTFVATCNEKEEEAAKTMCTKYMGKGIENTTGSRRDAFADCVFDVCAGGGEAAAELAAEIMTEGDY